MDPPCAHSHPLARPQGVGGRPFWGSQFHPEKNIFEQGMAASGLPYEAIHHDRYAIAASQVACEAGVARTRAAALPADLKPGARYGAVSFAALMRIVPRRHPFTVPRQLLRRRVPRLHTQVQLGQGGGGGALLQLPDEHQVLARLRPDLRVRQMRILFVWRRPLVVRSCFECETLWDCGVCVARAASQSPATRRAEGYMVSTRYPRWPLANTQEKISFTLPGDME